MKLWIATLIVGTPAAALACLHPGGGGSHTTSVTQNGQQALIVHHDGVEDLVLRVEYEGLAETPSLAWIVPVPAAPTDYGTADDALFDDLNEWVNLRRVWRPRSRSRGRSSSGSRSSSTLVMLPAAQVGPFAVQPIQANGAQAATELNEWMTTNGFQPLPEANIRYYVERSWTFLAIKITPNSGTLSGGGGLPPLRITFPSERAVFPLKLSTHMGMFPVRAYLITSEALTEEAFAGARARGFEVASGGRHYRVPGLPRGRLETHVRGPFPAERAPASLRPLLARLSGPAHLSVLFSRHFNNIEGNVDGFEQRSALWREDLSVPALPEGARLEGVPGVAQTSMTAADTATEDTATEDTATEDTAAEDTTAEDTATEDTATEDTATEDTAAEETAMTATSSGESTATNAASDDSGGCAAAGSAHAAWAGVLLLVLGRRRCTS
ncbi:MAG: DUF2330 domain-containing protein [Myxococcota bacterium]